MVAAATAFKAAKPDHTKDGELNQMSMTALEVAAIFKIEDQATNVLRRIAEEARALGRELKEIALGIDKSFGTAFASMTGGVTGQMADVKLLAGEWRNVAAAARAAGVASHTAGMGGIGNPGRRLGGGGGPHGPLGGGRGPHVPPMHIPTPGSSVGIGAGMLGLGEVGGNAALIGAAALGVGMWDSAEIDHLAYQAVYNAHSGQMPDAPAVQKEMQQFRDMVIREAIAVQMPFKDVAQSAVEEIRTRRRL